VGAHRQAHVGVECWLTERRSYYGCGEVRWCYGRGRGGVPMLYAAARIPNPASQTSNRLYQLQLSIFVVDAVFPKRGYSVKIYF